MAGYVQRGGSKRRYLTGWSCRSLAASGALALVAIAAPPFTAPPLAADDGATGAPVTAVVRTTLGELKWVATDATDYTPLEEKGRQIYLKSGCTYCHSQYARPEFEETRPWGRITTDPRRQGPIPEPGEYTFDDPPTFGNGGLAPDLARVGLKYGDEWHLAHFWSPPMITKGSIMGGFSGLFDGSDEPIAIVDGEAGPTLERTDVTEALFDFRSEDQIKLTPSPDGLLFVPREAQGKFPLIWTPNDEYTGERVDLVIETETIEALTAYVQKLGTNRGRWREFFEPAVVDGSVAEVPRSDAMIARGKQVYEHNCVACHGVEGNGNGPAATFTYNQRPRDFTLGVFKFRLTQDPLPTDADLLRTITRGVRGTAMPSWFELPLDDRLSVIQYIKYELAADRYDPEEPYFYFVEEPHGEPLEIGEPPAPSMALVERGQEIWRQAKCWECHGDEGKGDGEKAPGLKDDLGFPIVPANLTLGQFKSGPYVTDLYRTISTGFSGTPMPSFRKAFPDEDRWALAYYILSLSAYTDPLSAADLPLSPATRAALDDPALQTSGPEDAYGRQQVRAQ